MAFWIVGLLIFVGLLITVFVIAVVWAAGPREEGVKDPREYSEELNRLHSEREVTDSIIEALRLIPSGTYSLPEVDPDDESFLRHLDENYGVIKIRTQEMCGEGMAPEFLIETPSSVCGGFDDFDEEPFNSLEGELEYYLAGARAIAEALVEAGLARILKVTINEENYSL